jgi:hypothetical protein
MSQGLMTGGESAPPTSRSFRFALLGLGLLLFAAGHADADPLYGFGEQALSTPVTATVGFASSIQQGTFRYDRDVACYYECGASALLSWSTPDDGDALDSSDTLALENGYAAVVLVNDEDYLTNWGMKAGRASGVHVALEEGIERDLLLPR